MKKSLYFLVALFAISVLACQDGKDQAKDLADFSFYRNIGKRIPTETGYRWMDVYRTNLKLAGREKPSGYALSKENLAALSASVENLVGIVFQHGTDDSGAHHFVLIPIDESLQIWTSGKLIIDANTDSPVSPEEARQWAKNYQAGNPGSIMYHFFGKHVFDELSTISFFEYIQIEPAINDVNFAPQVLLIVNDLTADVSSGRSQYEEAVVYDMSSACPTHCSLEEN
ncbi:MAG TPA: hypothetical protein VGD65_22110 [Chryseosolibacter sp.]